MSRERLHTMISEASVERMRALKDMFGFTDDNELLEKLILEEFERRNGPLILGEEKVPYGKRKKKIA